MKNSIRLRLNKLKITSFLQCIILTTAFAVNVSAESTEGKIRIYDHFRNTELIYDLKDKYHPELLKYGYYSDNSYDLIYDFFCEDTNEELHWVRKSDDNFKTIRIYFVDCIFTGGYLLPSCKDLTVRIPDTINGVTVTEFYKSGAFKAFDVNPENKYFKSDGQVVLSKDGKKLLSYAAFNEDVEYIVPHGTEIIRDSAFCDCCNLKSISLPESIKAIEKNAFANMWSLENIFLADFDIEIDRGAFVGYTFFAEQTNASLICTKKLKTSVQNNNISWEKIPDASYYEVYQKFSSGDYKLLKKTTRTSCRFKALKNNKNYIFAVKPVAVIPAANYDKEKDEGNYPETFTIEGTMSEDIVVKG